MELKYTNEWDKIFWAYNLPLQMWNDGEGEWRILNYMPRKEKVMTLDEKVSKEDLPVFCRNASEVLRNLADLFDALGRGEIDTIYYPDQSVEDAKKDK